MIRTKKEIRVHLLGIPNFNLMGSQVDYFMINVVSEDERINKPHKFRGKGGSRGATLQQILKLSDSQSIESFTHYRRNVNGLWVDTRNFYTISTDGVKSKLVSQITSLFDKKFATDRVQKSVLLNGALNTVAYARAIRESSCYDDGRKMSPHSVFGSTGKSENGRVLYGLKR